MTRPWIRFEVDYLSHAKLRRAGPNARVAWPHILAAVKRASGYASDDDLDPFVFADQVGLDEPFWEGAIADLKTHGLLVWAEGVVRLNKKAVRDVAGWQPPNWGGYQYDNRPSGRQRKAAASRAVPSLPREGDTTPGNASPPPGRPVPSSPVGLSETSSKNPLKPPDKRKRRKQAEGFADEQVEQIRKVIADGCKLQRCPGGGVRAASIAKWTGKPWVQAEGFDAAMTLARWLVESQHQMAVFLREKGKAGSVTPWRESHFSEYLGHALDPIQVHAGPSVDVVPQNSSDWVPFPGAPGRKVHRDTDGTWLPNSSNLLDPAFPWRAVLRDVMAGILRRRDAGERVDKYVPEPFLAALRECSHPARPEQQIHLSNILGRLVDEIEGAQ